MGYIRTDELEGRYGEISWYKVMDWNQEWRARRREKERVQEEEERGAGGGGKGGGKGNGIE